MTQRSRFLTSMITMAFLAGVLTACGPKESQPPAASPAALDGIAKTYVQLVLALGEHDEGYVDAYYGPPEWREEAATRQRPLTEISTEATRLLAEVEALSLPGAEEIVVLRHRYLASQLKALIARIGMLQGEQMSFDEESRALYDAVAPTHPAEHFEAILARLDAKLAEAGLKEGDVSERLEAFRQRFVIPKEKVDTVFRAAVDACRERTAPHLDLPESESFVIEYVENKPWSGYNWYKGKYHSLIQVNLDLPIFIDRAIDLACHEGYPGHHVYNALLEKNLVIERGWVELSVYPLYSPQSLIAEGSANYGIEMAFPGEERWHYEREVLFPLAGLDPAQAETYYAVQEAAQGLSYAGNEAARGYLDGKLDAVAAIDWMVRYGGMGRERAEQRLRFIETYRSYVINYNLGLDLVREYVEKKGGDDPARRWEVFDELLSSPRLPSSLQVE